ncbi:MAG: M23 family metallopeptidase [Gemmatimonadaceae bacterium]|nr:M23 family metallopeptidase [Gemmatimonadaceae bacterium]
MTDASVTRDHYIQQNQSGMRLASIIMIFVACSDRQTIRNQSRLNQIASANTKSACWPRVLSIHEPPAHDGVDFAICAGEHIVSIAPGRVMMVRQATRNETGGGISIQHRRPSGEPMSVLYAHFGRIYVSENDWVSRGQALGEAWIPKDPLPWFPHVHIQLMTTFERSEDNPLEIVKGCRSRTPPPTPIFPVSC